jgi:hypothetical protein
LDLSYWREVEGRTMAKPGVWCTLRGNDAWSRSAREHSLCMDFCDLVIELSLGTELFVVTAFVFVVFGFHITISACC